MEACNYAHESRATAGGSRDWSRGPPRPDAGDAPVSARLAWLGFTAKGITWLLQLRLTAAPALPRHVPLLLHCHCSCRPAGSAQAFSFLAQGSSLGAPVTA